MKQPPSVTDRLAELVSALTGADPSASAVVVSDAGSVEADPDPLVVVARALVRLGRTPATAPVATPPPLPRRRAQALT